MRKIACNTNIYVKLLSIGVLVLAIFARCNPHGNESISNSVSASPLNGSVDVVENFLKRNYLRDPDSYKGREWGKLIRNPDGTFQVSHRFSAKNGFGGVDTETVLFCISADGKKVHICTNSDLERIARSEEKLEEFKVNTEYIEKDFSNTPFEGIISETIDGINEESTLKGELSKAGNTIKGNVEILEKETKYHLTGQIIGEGEIDIEFKNIANGNIIILKGYIQANLITAFTKEKDISFHLNQTK